MNTYTPDQIEDNLNDALSELLFLRTNQSCDVDELMEAIRKAEVTVAFWENEAAKIGLDT